LLFAQFSFCARARPRHLGGYLFTALMLIPWMLTFPGVFTPGGLLGAGLSEQLRGCMSSGTPDSRRSRRLQRS